jgi:bacterioferritin-associated ferredoxin
MIVCLCKAVSDRQIRAAIQRGADTLDAVQRTCGAGAGCGACRKEVGRILYSEAVSDSGSEDDGLELGPAELPALA